VVAARGVPRARQAVLADVAELVRLRGVMLAETCDAAPAPGVWQRLAAETLCRRMSDGTLAAFVVDRPAEPAAGGPGEAGGSGPRGPAAGDGGADHDPVGPPSPLVACAVGTIECRLGDPGNPTGEAGYVLNVVTEPGYRRRGYSRACLEALLDWYRRRGVLIVDLRATAAGEPLYRSLGFEHSSLPVLRLDARGRAPTGSRPG
jgi:Acetyltransferases